MQQTKLQTAHVYNPQPEQQVVELYHRKPFLNVCIVMPTYNESGNIVNILDKIYVNEKKIKEARGNVSVNVLVVDDNSPDGTADLVKEYSKKNSHVYLLKRKNKEGLGKAYIAGMKYALRKINPDIIFEMDADGQHNPDYIPTMIEEVERGSDFVIGSRYIGGGETPKGWGWQREMMSYLARNISRVGLGLGDIKDCSGGFRAIRANVLKTIDLNSLDVRGYAFQVVLLEEVVHHGFLTKEIPISFEERDIGESKMGMSDIIEGWKIIFKVRSRRLSSKLYSFLG